MQHDPELALSAREIARRAVDALEEVQGDLENASALLMVLATAEDVTDDVGKALRAVDLHIWTIARRSATASRAMQRVVDNH